MAPPLGLQLYTVREELKGDAEAVIRKIAEIGYAGVETAGLPGMTLQQSAKLFSELNLKVPSVHSAMPVGDQRQEVLETAEAFGAQWLVAGLRPADFETEDLIKQSCETFNEASRSAREAGLAFAIHNHYWEFESIGERRVYEVMLDFLDPEVLFEFDTYWAQVGGTDPVEALGKIASRTPLLHIKDGPATREASMQAIGDGVVDFQGIAEASKGTGEWWIVELDHCDTDMMEAVEKSHAYLTSEGLASGQ
jgi:sugar phosphate isomerase/epimerase